MGEPWAMNPYGYVNQSPTLLWDPEGLTGKLTESQAGNGTIESIDFSDEPSFVVGEIKIDPPAANAATAETPVSKDDQSSIRSMFDKATDYAGWASDLGQMAMEAPNGTVLGTMTVKPYTLSLPGGVTLGPFSSGRPRLMYLPRGGVPALSGKATYGSGVRILNVVKGVGTVATIWSAGANAYDANEALNRGDHSTAVAKGVGTLGISIGWFVGGPPGVLAGYFANAISDITNPKYQNIPACPNYCHGQ